MEDGTVDGGLGSAVLEWMADHNYFVSVTRKGVPDRFIPQGSPAELHRLCGFDEEGIYETIKSICKPNKIAE